MRTGLLDPRRPHCSQGSILNGISKREEVPEAELLSISAVIETSAARAPVTARTENRSIKAPLRKLLSSGPVRRMSRYLSTALYLVTVSKTVI
jgi:hypothetical protein